MAMRVELIRELFPALRRTVEKLDGRPVPVAFFDGPGGTQVPKPVAEAMTEYLLHHNANTHWAYPTSIETDAMLAASRETVADLLHVSPREISFANNMTTGTFHLARALGRKWGPGDEVVITELDHHANVAPWRALEKERGLTIRQVRMDPATGQLDFDALRSALGARTRLLAIGAASNALGTITDVKEATVLAHTAGAQVFVDAVHFAPHALLDIRSIGCDWLGCSAYKFYGPHVGIIYGREDLIASLDAPRLEPAPDYAPELLETGTQNHEGIVGAAAAVEFIASIGAEPGLTSGSARNLRRAQLERAFSALHERGMALFTRLWEALGALDGVTRYGPGPERPRTPTLSFTVRGHGSESVAKALAARGVFVSHGDFYATTVVERLDQAKDGLVRAGASCYTTADEVDRLVDGVREVLAAR